MSTTGDRKLTWSLQEKGGKGLFTKELETALLNGQADLAVHSAKDMPTENPKGLLLPLLLKERTQEMFWFCVIMFMNLKF